MARKLKIIYVQAVYRPRLDCFVVLFRNKVMYRCKEQFMADAYVKGWNDEAAKREQV